MQKRTKVNVIKIRTTFDYEKLRMTLSCGMTDDLLEIEARTEQWDGFNLGTGDWACCRYCLSTESDGDASQQRPRDLCCVSSVEWSLVATGFTCEKATRSGNRKKIYSSVWKRCTA